MLNRFLETVAGDTLSFRVVLRGGASPVDVSPLNFTGGVRKPGTTENLVNFAFEPVNGVIGVVRAVLSPDKTMALANAEGQYEWYIRLERGDYVKTLGFGALRVVTL